MLVGKKFYGKQSRYNAVLDDGFGTNFKSVPLKDIRPAPRNEQREDGFKTLHAWGVWTPFASTATPMLMCSVVSLTGAGHGSVVLVDDNDVFETDTHGRLTKMESCQEAASFKDFSTDEEREAYCAHVPSLNEDISIPVGHRFDGTPAWAKRHLIFSHRPQSGDTPCMLDVPHEQQGTEFWYMGALKFKNGKDVRDMKSEQLSVYYEASFYRPKKLTGDVFPVALWDLSQTDEGKVSKFGYKKHITPRYLGLPGYIREYQISFTKAKQLNYLSTKIGTFSDFHRFQAIYWNCNSFVQFFATLFFYEETTYWFQGGKTRPAPFGRAETGMSHSLVKGLATIHDYGGGSGLQLPEGVDKHMREDWMRQAVRHMRGWMNGNKLPNGVRIHSESLLRFRCFSDTVPVEYPRRVSYEDMLAEMDAGREITSQEAAEYDSEEDWEVCFIKKAMEKQ